MGSSADDFMTDRFIRRKLGGSFLYASEQEVSDKRDDLSDLSHVDGKSLMQTMEPGSKFYGTPKSTVSADFD